MKILVIALGLSLTPLVAFAADEDKKPSPPLTPKTPEDARGRFLSRYDKNGDGKIDEAERTAAMQERRKEIEAREKERIKQYDKNGDGKLDDDERAAAREDFLKQKRGQTVDKDAPGKSSPPPPLPIERPPVKKLPPKASDK